MNSRTNQSSEHSFSPEKGFIDPLSDIDECLEKQDSETTVRYLNKRKMSKLWKVLTTNII